MLSAHRRHGKRRRDPARRSSRKCCWQPLRNGRVAPSTTIRPPAWKRRSKRAISDGRDAENRYRAPVCRRGHRGLSGSAQTQEPAALHHLRQRRRRQIDADWPIALRLKTIFEDQLAALEADRKRMGTQGRTSISRCWWMGLPPSANKASPSTLPIGFSRRKKRKFIVADTPGHEQYTRNMVTGASTADLAIILVDARKGVLTQTRRHSYLAHLLGIRNFVLAVNKMDLIDYDQTKFDAIVADYRAFAHSIGIGEFVSIPISGLQGRQHHRALRQHPLVSRPPADRATGDGRLRQSVDQARPFRMPVQWVNRPNLDFRGFSGLISSGAFDRAMRSASALRQDHPRQPHRLGEGAVTCRQRGCRSIRHGLLHRGGRLLPRRCVGRRPTILPSLPISSRRHWCGCRKSRCFPAGPIGSSSRHKR